MPYNLEGLTPISEDDAINEILLYGSTICLMRLQGGGLYFSIKDFTDFFDEADGVMANTDKHWNDGGSR